MSERDEERHVAVGGGSPVDPDPRSDGDGGSDVSGDTQTPGDVVRAVVEFVDDLVEDAVPEDASPEDALPDDQASPPPDEPTD